MAEKDRDREAVREPDRSDPAGSLTEHNAAPGQQGHDRCDGEERCEKRLPAVRHADIGFRGPPGRARQRPGNAAHDPTATPKQGDRADRLLEWGRVIDRWVATTWA